jgi:hypothetical protein
MSSNQLDNSSEDQGQNIVVAVRVRPLHFKETQSGQKSCCSVLDDSTLSIRKAGDSTAYLKSQVNDTINNFTFDQVFDESSTQKDIYLKTIQKFVPKIHLGQHVTIFAYGATGAGKTHTMFGDLDSNDALSHESDGGIIIKAVKDLLDQTDQRRKRAPDGEIWITSFAFMEVYNEQVFDLLSYTGKNLSIREDSEKGIIQVTGLSETVIQSVPHFMELVRHGQKYRKMEPTLANTVSSRSHAILQVVVRCLQRNKFGKETLTESKLSLVDLAGSERVSRTGNTQGIRHQEGANINKSLLALSNCINALAENFSLPSLPSSASLCSTTSMASKKNNVKFRDSKLTHLLKSSLEGNSYLIMLANINPSDLTYEDSLKTLYYAKRAKFIKVNPTVKTNLLDSTSLEREIQLRAENELLMKRIEEQDAEFLQLQETIAALQMTLADKEKEISALVEATAPKETAGIECQTMTMTDEVSCQVDHRFLIDYHDSGCQTVAPYPTRPSVKEMSCQTPVEFLPVKIVEKVVEKVVEKIVEKDKIIEKIVEKVVEKKVPVEVKVNVPVPTATPSVVTPPLAPIVTSKPTMKSMECQTDDISFPIRAKGKNHDDDANLSIDYSSEMLKKLLSGNDGKGIQIPGIGANSYDSMISSVANTGAAKNSEEDSDEEDDGEVAVNQIYFNNNELRKMKKSSSKRVSYNPVLMRHQAGDKAVAIKDMPRNDDSIYEMLNDHSAPVSPSSPSSVVRDKIQKFERNSSKVEAVIVKTALKTNINSYVSTHHLKYNNSSNNSNSLHSIPSIQSIKSLKDQTNRKSVVVINNGVKVNEFKGQEINEILSMDEEKEDDSFSASSSETKLSGGKSERNSTNPHNQSFESINTVDILNTASSTVNDKEMTESLQQSKLFKSSLKGVAVRKSLEIMTSSNLLVGDRDSLSLSTLSEGEKFSTPTSSESEECRRQKKFFSAPEIIPLKKGEGKSNKRSSVKSKRSATWTKFMICGCTADETVIIGP